MDMLIKGNYNFLEAGADLRGENRVTIATSNGLLGTPVTILFTRSNDFLFEFWNYEPERLNVCVPQIVGGYPQMPTHYFYAGTATT